MAKPVLSSTLKNLKFMQRAAQREEMMLKKEEVEPEAIFASHRSVSRKCVVIMESDPRPEVVRGRMSFQNFNPTIDKLYEEPSQSHQSPVPASSSDRATGSLRKNGRSSDQGQCSNMDETASETNGDLKRKKSESVSECQYPRKSPKNNHDDHSSPASKSKDGFKKPTGNSLDWNLLRRPKN